MVQLNELPKRKEYGYTDDSMNLDSIKYSKHNLYPYYSYIKYESVTNIHEQLIEHSLDMMSTSTVLINPYDHTKPLGHRFCVIGGFQNIEDFNAFFNGLINKIKEDNGLLVNMILTTVRQSIPTLV